MVDIAVTARCCSNVNANLSGLDFDNPENGWSCEDNEIDKLLAFLEHDVYQSGRYRRLGLTRSDGHPEYGAMPQKGCPGDQRYEGAATT